MLHHPYQLLRCINSHLHIYFRVKLTKFAENSRSFAVQRDSIVPICNGFFSSASSFIDFFALFTSYKIRLACPINSFPDGVSTTRFPVLSKSLVSSSFSRRRIWTVIADWVYPQNLCCPGKALKLCYMYKRLQLTDFHDFLPFTMKFFHRDDEICEFALFLCQCYNTITRTSIVFLCKMNKIHT